MGGFKVSEDCIAVLPDWKPIKVNEIGKIVLYVKRYKNVYIGLLWFGSV